MAGEQAKCRNVADYDGELWLYAEQRTIYRGEAVATRDCRVEVPRFLVEGMSAIADLSPQTLNSLPPVH